MACVGFTDILPTVAGSYLVFNLLNNLDVMPRLGHIKKYFIESSAKMKK